jgi:hypothetical protein
VLHKSSRGPSGLVACRRRQTTVLALCRSAHHHKLCVGKFDTHDPTLPLILEVRAIRAPHQDEPRIGRNRRGGWVIRAFAPRLTTTPMLPFERKASPSCMGRATVVNGRISDFTWLISGGIAPQPQRAGPRCASSRIKPDHRFERQKARELGISLLERLGKSFKIRASLLISQTRPRREGNGSCRDSLACQCASARGALSNGCLVAGLMTSASSTAGHRAAMCLFDLRFIATGLPRRQPSWRLTNRSSGSPRSPLQCLEQGNLQADDCDSTLCRGVHPECVGH